MGSRDARSCRYSTRAAIAPYKWWKRLEGARGGLWEGYKKAQVRGGGQSASILGTIAYGANRSCRYAVISQLVLGPRMVSGTSL